MSVGQLWDRLNDPRRRPEAPQSTYDAALFELREYGIMQLAKPNTQRSERILTDNELRAIWHASGDGSQFGTFVRLLLLSGQRKAKVGTMRWSDLHGDVWTIRREPREKSNAGSLQLPSLAREVLAALPRFAGNDFVFAGRGAEPFNGGSFKAQFDARCGVTGWTLHDLRRTARSLMSRAGVSREHAERVLGRVIGGVEGTYNRHKYDAEKGVALRKLANLVTRIVSAPDDNVVELRGAGAVKKKKQRGRPRLPEDAITDAAIKRREARKREQAKRRRLLAVPPACDRLHGTARRTLDLRRRYSRTSEIAVRLPVGGRSLLLVPFGEHVQRGCQRARCAALDITHQCPADNVEWHTVLQGQ
jgi:hypothetical protein